jgi:succinate dehydrogenase hydrophobic anchor subunit
MDQSDVSDEFIYESFVKTTRFNITLTLSTIGAIIALFKLTEGSIEKSLSIAKCSIGFSASFFLLALFGALLGQIVGTCQIIEKCPVEKIEKRNIKFIWVFWLLYGAGVAVAANVIWEIVIHS